MDSRSFLRVSIVLDGRVTPQLGDLHPAHDKATIDDVRSIALRLRTLRVAWKEIALLSRHGAPWSQLQPRLRHPGGDMVRVDVSVESSVPLVLGSASSADDAHAKLESLSGVFAAEIDVLEVSSYKTELGLDPALFAVSPWRAHWYCICGGVSLDDVEVCSRCGRARRSSEVQAPAAHALAA